MLDAPIDIVDRDRVVVWPPCDRCGLPATIMRRLACPDGEDRTLTFCGHHASAARIVTPLNTAGWESYRLMR